MISYNRNKSFGVGNYENTNYTFQISGKTRREVEERHETLQQFYGDLEDYYINVGGYYIFPYGERNNFPVAVRNLLRENHLTPELFEKKTRIQYGQGPYLYREEIVDGKINRVAVDVPEITQWLNSWNSIGIKNDYRTYLQRCIHEFHYLGGVFTKFYTNRAARIGKQPKFAGLEFLPSKRARMEYHSQYDNVQRIIVGDYTRYTTLQLVPYPVLDKTRPFAANVAINYSKFNSFADDYYPVPAWYGLATWIRNSNNSPEFVESYLDNFLAAAFHVIIPQSWIVMKEESLHQQCAARRARKETENTEYNEAMLNELIDNKLNTLVATMSGKSNQGKIFVTQKVLTAAGIEGWEIIPINKQIRDYISSMIDVDKQAMFNISSGVGLHPAISNLSRDGNLPSGSEQYYAYMIYLNTLDIPEEIITSDINFAIHTNFPQYANVRLGFYHAMPAKQQDITLDDRVQQTVFSE